MSRVLVSRPAGVPDPALASISIFRDVEARFNRWLSEDHAAIVDRREWEAQEGEWCDEYAQKLDAAVSSVPTTKAGLHALSTLFVEQYDKWAPYGVIESASRSMQIAAGTMTDEEWNKP